MGARQGDTFAGFLFESFAITLGGGEIGIAWVLTKAARLLPIPNGAESAQRAAAVYPVEALRTE